MKWTNCLAASLFALLALPAGVRADPVVDGDGDEHFGPVAARPNERTYSPEERQELEKEEADEARSRNWLLVGYEEQLSRTQAQSPDKERASDNIYLQVSMNKELARLADLPVIDPNIVQGAPALHATPTVADRLGRSPLDSPGSMSLRPETTPTSGIPARQSLTPLVAPLGSPAPQAAQPYFTSSFAIPMASILDPPKELSSTTGESSSVLAPRPSPEDTIDMETPGMVASKNDPLTGPPDLTLDSMPDDDAAQAHQPQDAPPVLSQAMDLDQMRTDQQAKLSAPTQANAPKTVAAAQAKPPTPAQQTQQQQASESEATPISQQPMISPVHAPIADPADFLNH